MYSLSYTIRNKTSVPDYPCLIAELNMGTSSGAYDLIRGR